MRLRHGRIYPGKSSWGGRHARWLAEQAFAHPAHHIVLQVALNAARGAAEQVKRLEAALVEIVPTWSMAPVVDAFRAMRGVGFVAAVICVAELGDLRRFDHLTKDGKHTGRLRNREHLPAFSARAGGGAGVMIGLSR
jgi:transposase